MVASTVARYHISKFSWKFSSTLPHPWIPRGLVSGNLRDVVVVAICSVGFLEDLLYVQHVKAMGNRETFHPNKLDYDLFNIEIDIGPINLFLHGLFLKKLWWVKVSSPVKSRMKIVIVAPSARKISSVGIRHFTTSGSRT